MTWLFRLLSLLALVNLSGLHVAVVQSYAWVTMIHDRSATTTFEQAVAETFSGEHPCEVCSALVERTEEEQEHAPETVDQIEKLVATADRARAGLYGARDCSRLSAVPSLPPPSISHDCPTPPPRRG